MVQQVRIGIYPQLERPLMDIYQDGGYATGGQVMPMALPVAPPQAEAVMEDIKPIAPMDAEQQANAVNELAEAEISNIPQKLESRSLKKMAKEPMQQQNNYSYSKSDFQRVDPKAKVQTGPVYRNGNGIKSCCRGMVQ